MPHLPLHEASAGEPSDHPSEGVLAAYLDTDLTDDERSLVEEHLERCDACRRAIADTVEVLDAPGVAAHPPSHAEAAGHRRNRMRWAAVGVALAASVAAIIVVQRSPEASADAEGRVRAPTPNVYGERTPVLSAVAPVDGASRVDQQPTFSWRSANVGRYSFKLLAEDGVPIWSYETPDTTLSLPSELRLEPGRSYFWRVDALAAGIVASTPAQRFTVQP